MKRDRILQVELRKAIKDSKLELHYQPIVDANHHDLRGFEGLARWQRKNGEWVSPGEFIPLAEKSGMIVDLELWALKTAITQLDAWNRQHPATKFYVSINLTFDTIQDERLYDLLGQWMSDHLVKAGQLKLELTERLLIDDHSDVLSKLDQLIGLGCELMIDDFGTGYSSLSYLHRLPVKTLKIDRCFVMELGKNDNSQHVLNAIITLAKSLDLKLIAEGVETMEQSYHLQTLGADLLQGYLFSRPLCAKDAGREVELSCQTSSLSNNDVLLLDLGLSQALSLKH